MDILKSIDIALAMVLVYLIFSLGVTAFNEFLAAFLSSRARWLRRGIESLLNPAGGPVAPDPQVRKALDAQMQAFYASPYISYLGDAPSRSPLSRQYGPSYIPAWHLVQGLLDAANQGRAPVLSTFDQVRTAVGALPDRSPIKVALTELLTRADGQLDTLKTLVDEWFKAFETQVSAWYRQKTQVVLVVLSMGVAGVANLDTIAMVRALSADAKLRETLVTRAIEASGKPGIEALLDTSALTRAQQALAVAQAASQSTPALQAQVDEERRKLFSASSALMDSVNGTGLPIGWQPVDRAALNWRDVLLKIAGLVMSGFALSLGAPFWFDMLQKLASIRSVGKSLTERAALKPPPA